MSRVTELEKALTTLFRKGTEVGYAETEIDEFLENIDYHALLQAVWNKAETVYAYRADGKNALILDYRSAELFKQRATLLYDKAHELWTKGERLIEITTTKGYQLTIDYFPSIQVFICSNGYYELSAADIETLSQLLQITD